jgi:uncharacterized membrane protein
VPYWLSLPDTEVRQYYVLMLDLLLDTLLGYVFLLSAALPLLIKLVLNQGILTSNKFSVKAFAYGNLFWPASIMDLLTTIVPVIATHLRKVEVQKVESHD